MADCPDGFEDVVGVATVGPVDFPAAVGFLDGVGIAGLLGLPAAEALIATT